MKLIKMLRELTSPEANHMQKIYRIGFPSKSLQRINAIAKKTGVETPESVISDAVRTYESITDHLEKGTVFWAQSTDGEMVPVTFLRQPVRPNSGQEYLTLVVDNDPED